MKLAEALIQRVDTQTRIQELRQRLTRNARVQEGDRPAEAPEELLAEILAGLIQRINRTNAGTEFAPGQTISDALAERDVLALRQKVYRDLAGEATGTGQERFRWTRSEIKFQNTVEVAEVQRQADLARSARRSTGKSISSSSASW